MAKSTTSFKAGSTGNKAGRPTGTTPRARFRKMVDPDMPAIVQTLIQAAQGGDVAAIKVILDRLIPALKPTADGLSLKTTGTLTEQGAAIVKAMLAGHATPDQAKTSIDVLAGQAKLQEHSDILIRIEQLEGLLLCQSSSKS